MNNNPHDDLPLSNNPEENLRMRNELLRLKVRAELGAIPQITDNIPPEIENEFLKNMLEFESGYAEAKQIKIYELLGKPEFKLSANLNDEAIEQALEEITALLGKNLIVVDYLGTYDSRTKYRFITEELFEHETDDVNIPGLVTHFTYEEFHPNHRLDIESRTMEFISAWFNKQLHEQPWAFAHQLIQPSGKTWTKFEIADKLKKVFANYSKFTDGQYHIEKIDFELHDSNGMGYAEGAVKYVALGANQEPLQIEGPFKLYFSLDDDWWSIFYFVFPGFENEDM